MGLGFRPFDIVLACVFLSLCVPGDVELGARCRMVEAMDRSNLDVPSAIRQIENASVRLDSNPGELMWVPQRFSLVGTASGSRSCDPGSP